ncbi:MAG: HesA/MoeB/ThiF family protein [Planctomycetota bacterium]|jgi:adenylyltransferase/sulfurtransferase
MDDRYLRQILFAPLGKEGQKKLRAARVTLVGCGGLGSVIADHLVRAGVGFLRICDADRVETKNLHSQLLYDRDDARENRPKAEAARARLAKVNPDVEIEAEVVRVAAENVAPLVEGADLVMDGTDNFETRFVVNEACVRRGIPWIHGAVAGSTGQMMVVRPGEGPCYACLLPDAPPAGSAPTSDTAGVLNTLISLVAALQCTEAIKLLTGNTGALRGGLVALDLWDNRLRTLRVMRLPDCPVCGGR